MIKKRLNKLSACILATVLLFGVMSGSVVKAAGYKQINSSGSVDNYLYKNNGKKIVIKNSKSGSEVDTIKGKYAKNIEMNIVTNGKTLFYAENKYDSKTTGYIIKYDLKKKKTQLILSVNELVSVEAFYKNKVYFCKGDFEPDLYVYNLKTKKQSKVASCSNVTGIYGSKLVLSIISGDYSPNQIYIYDAEKSKKKTIKNTLGSNVIGKYLYYSGTNNFKGSNCNIYVRKYDLMSGKSVDLAEVNAESVRNISDEGFMYCVHSTSGDSKYYRYNIATGESKEINYNEFNQ